MRDVDESYLIHAKNALFFSVNAFFASVALAVHAVLPFLFTVTGSSIITRLWEVMSLRVRFIFGKKNPRVAIIGFGASGMVTLYNLVKSEKTITAVDIFDKDFLSFGVAYNTNNMQHLLNVRASNMSAVDGDKNHFVQWLGDNGFSYSSSDFVPRAIYGLYLKDMVREAKAIALKRKISINFYHTEVKNITRKSDFFVIRGDVYSECYLCIGAALHGGEQNYWNMPKSDLKSYIQSRKTIHIIGAGLSAFDAVLEAITLGFEGNFVLYSRSGLMPHSHSDSKIVCDTPSVQSWTVRKFISACRNSQDWRSVLDSIRPVSQQIWQSISLAKKKSIISHGFRFWSIHRHRAAQKIHDIITSLIKDGIIVIDKNSPPLDAIDCTGFSLTNVTELEKSLIKSGIIGNDDLCMGIFPLCKNFYIIGAKNFGTLFETIAIPEIRFQARQTVSGSCIGAV